MASFNGYAMVECTSLPLAREGTLGIRVELYAPAGVRSTIDRQDITSILLSAERNAQEAIDNLLNEAIEETPESDNLSIDPNMCTSYISGKPMEINGVYMNVHISILIPRIAIAIPPLINAAEHVLSRSIRDLWEVLDPKGFSRAAKEQDEEFEDDSPVAPHEMFLPMEFFGAN